MFYEFFKNIEKNCTFALSIDAQISFFNLLVKVITRNNSIFDGGLLLENPEIYGYFLSHLSVDSAVEAAATTACIELVKCRRNSFCSDQKEHIKSMLDLIYSKFPDIKQKYKDKKAQTIESIFRPLVSDYLRDHSKQLEKFKVPFPYLSEVFVEPLKALSLSKTPLYRFFLRATFFWSDLLLYK